MRLNLRLLAASLALVFASATAQGFRLDTAGPAAKWRSDIVKKGGKFTTCVLTAWYNCEVAATKAGSTLGPTLDCDIEADPVVAVPTSKVPGTAITKINTDLAKCNSGISDPLDTKGFSALNKSKMRLSDIGCFGDCDPSAPNGNQSCLDDDAGLGVALWEVAATDPDGNVRQTAGSIGGTLGAICGVGGDTTGSGINAVTKATSSYLGKVTTCIQKCQDDTKAIAGDGFRNDGTACHLTSTGKNALAGVGAFDSCVNKGYTTTLGKLTKNTPSADCTYVTGGLGGLLEPILASQLNFATNGSYDRTDLQTSGVTDLSDRSQISPQIRAAFGSCSDCGDGIREDYEECDGGAGNNSLCGTAAIPGTKAGNCALINIDPPPAPGQPACRCPR